MGEPAGDRLFRRVERSTSASAEDWSVKSVSWPLQPAPWTGVALAGQKLGARVEYLFQSMLSR